MVPHCCIQDGLYTLLTEIYLDFKCFTHEKSTATVLTLDDLSLLRAVKSVPEDFDAVKIAVLRALKSSVHLYP